MTSPFPLTQTSNAGFQVPQGGQDEKELFTEQFQAMAYTAFQKTQPELLNDVITFRVIDVSVEDGTGVGTFILKYANDIVFVPCVVADNAIKPLDMFYSRTADRFYPLTSNWLRTATKVEVSELGNASAPPKGMPTDVDIRNLVIPPTTGRYSYASDEEAAAALPFEAALDGASRREKTATLQFPKMLKEASNQVKVAFMDLLRRSTKLAHLYGGFYGAKALTAALTLSNETQKTAGLSVAKPMKRDVFIMTSSTPLQEAKAELEPGELADGYKMMRTHGFYVKDRRKNLKDIVAFSESDLGLSAPERSGIYDVYMANGKIERVLILVNPRSARVRRSDDVGEWRDDHSRQNRPEGIGLNRNYMVLFQDGRWSRMGRLLAEPVVDAFQKDVARFIEEMTTERPKANDHGTFISPGHYDVLGFEELWVRSVAQVDKNVTVVSCGQMTIRVDNRMSVGQVLKPQDSNTMMISGSYRWRSLKDWPMPEGEILADSRLITSVIEMQLERRGDQSIDVKVAADGFIIGGETRLRTGLDAIEKTATLYDLPLPTAANVLRMRASGVDTPLWASKYAAGESLDPSGAPTPAPQDMPQGPPPPSGLELASGEKRQQIMGQIAALQQQLAMIDELTQRAQMIDQGGGAVAAPAAAADMAAGPGMLQGQQPLVPYQQPQGQAQQPQAAQGQQQMANVAPLGAPEPPQEPMPPPVMTEAEPSAANLEQQVNPQFLESAQQLQDDGVFDAVAIASLAKNKNLSAVLQNYIPTLEKALDYVGRLLLVFGMKETAIKKSIGTDEHGETEQKLRDVFHGLGDSLLSLKQNADQLVSQGRRTVY